jgi:CBS domain-containing protein
MLVEDVMSDEVAAIDAETTIAWAAAIMKNYDVGFLPVLDDKRVLGVVTDRDIVIRGVSSECDIMSTKVRDVISNDLVYCQTNDTIEWVVRLMEKRKIHRLLVVDKKYKPVGVVSLGDIAMRCSESALVGKVLAKLGSRSSKVHSRLSPGRRNSQKKENTKIHRDEMNA